MTDSLQTKLRNLYRFSADERANPFERASAKDLFQKLCKKHGLSEEQFCDEPTSYHWFTFQNKFEERILVQCAAKVMNTYTVHSLKAPRSYGFKLTASQHVEMERLYGHYRRLFKKEMENLYHAFIQKHDIFPNVPSDSVSTDTDLETLRAIWKLMEALEDAPLPALALKAGN